MRDATLADPVPDIVSRQNIEADLARWSRFYNTLRRFIAILTSERVISMKHLEASMKNRLPGGASVIAIMWLCFGLGFGLGFVSLAYAQTNSQILSKTQKGTIMTTHASGTFEVKLNPQSAYEASLGRMSIDKQFHGDLEATSKGEMLSAMGSVKGSAGYVAMELVSGTLHGRSGTFVLQHRGVMTRGEPQLSVTVVPDSGTGQLVGLTGTMVIKITDGNHSYEFDYTLSETP